MRSFFPEFRRSAGWNGWCAFAALLLPFIALFLFLVASGVPDLALAGDGALLEISTRNTAVGQVLTGPYSRYEFHHPGPAYFFVRIPLYYLFGRSASASYLTVSLICILCLGGIFLPFRKHGHRLMSVFFCLFATIFLWSLKPFIWLNDWNPFIIIFPVLLTFTSFTAAAAGFHRYLPIAVAAGSFSVQTHIGCLPSVAAAAVFAAVYLIVLSRKNSRGTAAAPLAGTSISSSVLAAAVTAVILWTPVLLHEVISDSGSNLSAIFRFFREVPAGLSLRRSVSVWIDATSLIEGNFVGGEHLRRLGIMIHVKGIIVLARIMLLSVCCYFLHRKNRSSFTLVAGEMTLLLHITAFLAISQVRGEPFSYLFIWFAVLGLLSWTVIFTSITELFDVFKGEKIERRIILTGTAIAIVFSILNTASIWDEPSSDSCDPLSYHNELVMNLSDSLNRYLSSQDDHSWMIVPAEHDLWPLMTGLVNSLDKEGWNVSVPSDFTFMTDIQPDENSVPLYIMSNSSGIHRDIEVLFGHDNILICR